VPIDVEIKDPKTGRTTVIEWDGEAPPTGDDIRDIVGQVPDEAWTAAEPAGPGFLGRMAENAMGMIPGLQGSGLPGGDQAGNAIQRMAAKLPKLPSQVMAEGVVAAAQRLPEATSGGDLLLKAADMVVPASRMAGDFEAGNYGALAADALTIGLGAKAGRGMRAAPDVPAPAATAAAPRPTAPAGPPPGFSGPGAVATQLRSAVAGGIDPALTQAGGWSGLPRPTPAHAPTPGPAPTTLQTPGVYRLAPERGLPAAPRVFHMGGPVAQDASAVFSTPAVPEPVRLLPPGPDRVFAGPGPVAEAVPDASGVYGVPGTFGRDLSLPPAQGPAGLLPPMRQGIPMGPPAPAGLLPSHTPAPMGAPAPVGQGPIPLGPGFPTQEMLTNPLRLDQLQRSNLARYIESLQQAPPAAATKGAKKGKK
jgi:hypothetical protein